jgi:ferredoxin
LNVFLDKIEQNKPITKIFTKWYTFFDEFIVKNSEIKADNSHKDWIKRFTVDEGKCNNCLKCVKNCPRNNIKFTEKIMFSINCDVCFYCINNCSQFAINLSKNKINNVKYSEEKINELFRKRQTST